MDISVLLSTFKRPEILRKTLSSFLSLSAEDFSWELLVVDNADDSETAAVVEEFMHILPMQFLVEPNPGKNKALNRALPLARGELIVFTDDDVIVDPHWLKELWEAGRRWPKAEVFGGKIVAAWPDSPPPWGEDHPINKNLFGLHAPWSADTPYGEKDYLAHGANMAVKRSVFARGYRLNDGIGPNGTAIYRMGSEMEFLLRLRADGVLQVFIPRAVVKHQIRPDQVTREWIRKRGFRCGYTDFYEESIEGKILFNINLYLWKRFFENHLQVLWCRLKGNSFDEHKFYMDLYKTKGKMFSQAEKRSKHQNGFIARMLRT